VRKLAGVVVLVVAAVMMSGCTSSKAAHGNASITATTSCTASSESIESVGNGDGGASTALEAADFYVRAEKNPQGLPSTGWHPASSSSTSAAQSSVTLVSGLSSMQAVQAPDGTWNIVSVSVSCPGEAAPPVPSTTSTTTTTLVASAIVPITPTTNPDAAAIQHALQQQQAQICNTPAPHGEPNVDNPDGIERNTSCPVGSPAYPYIYGYGEG